MRLRSLSSLVKENAVSTGSTDRAKEDGREHSDKLQKRLWRHMKSGRRKTVIKHTETPVEQSAEVSSNQNEPVAERLQVMELHKNTQQDRVKESVEEPLRAPEAFAFMKLPPELRVCTCEKILKKFIYTTIRSDNAGRPTVILVLCMPERAILQV